MAAPAPPTPATTTDPDDRGLLAALVGDGRPLIMFTGMSLLLSGAFALFLSATGHFLPHDVEYLGMFPEELCAINECRIVHFMFHDRVSFGGAIIAVGMLYLWLAEFPLKAREPWAWWLLLVSGIVGFSSFLAYLGYGYLDTWHGLATLALLPCFVLGLSRSYRELPAGRSPRCLLVPGAPLDFRSRAGLGRLLLLGTSVGLVGAGCTIMLVGMTTVFVPQDLTYMGMTDAEIDAVNPRLIPLIAHDRAGFGGGVACGGLTLLFVVWCARPSRSWWQVLAIAGFVGFSTAIGIHPIVGYNDAVHLAPAVAGAVMFTAGLALTYRRPPRSQRSSAFVSSNVSNSSPSMS
jgi:hypothetical protein